jgi:hypothetical protein
MICQGLEGLELTKTGGVGIGCFGKSRYSPYHMTTEKQRCGFFNLSSRIQIQKKKVV